MASNRLWSNYLTSNYAGCVIALGRDFRLLASGQALSWFGGAFQQVALPVAVVLDGGGAGQLGVVLATEIGGLLVGVLLGGVWADRLQPTRVMVASDAVRLIAAAAIAVSFASGWHSLPLLCVLIAVSAIASSFFQPAMSSLKPLLVTSAALPRANSTLNLIQTVCSVAGPAAGGVVVAALGPAIGFGINSASFLASLATVGLIRARAEREQSDPLSTALAAGWREIRRHDWLTAGVFAATGYHVANGAVLVLVPILATTRLGGATAIGAVYAAEGVGGVLGALVAMRWHPPRMLALGWLVLILMPLGLLAFIWPGTLLLVAVGAIAGYAGLGYFSTAWETVIQQEIPHRLIARVASWDLLASFVAMPVGSLLAGPLSTSIGDTALLAGCAAVMTICVLAPLALHSTRWIQLRPSRLPPSPAGG